MSLGHSPKIVTDGLVFYYDMENTKKSWKGKPITNLWAANKSTYSWTTGTGTVTRNIPTSEMPPPFDFTGVEVVKVESTSDVFGTILWTVPGIEGPDVTYAHSIWVYVVDADSIGIGQHWNPWSYNHLRYPTPGRWERIEHINTTVDNTHTSVAIQYNVNKVGGGGIAYFCAPQYEKNSFVTPFVNGTRSNTEAILDMTGNNTITANSLTYNSDGSFEFGGDTIIDSGFGAGRNPSTEPFTVIAWVKSNTLSGNRMWLDAVNNGTNQRYYFSYLDENQISAFGIQASTWSGSVPQSTEWIQQAVVMNGTQARVFANGNFLTYKGYTSYTLVGNLQIGGRSGYYWSGKIGNFQIYDRALSDEEIKQNFNAIKGRYGL